jgi:hypothetical protein
LREPLIVAVKPILELAALILSLVNGLMLFRGYMRDRAILKVDPVHPDIYQWFFRLPSREHNGQTTRRYGFLAYIGILNAGRRDACLSAWRLRVRTRNWRQFEERSLTIKEPQVILNTGKKIYPVLGIKSENFSGETMIRSGASISGFCYYAFEFYGHSNFDLRIHDGKTVAEIVVKSAFGKTSKASITFKEISLEAANAMIPDVVKVGFGGLDLALHDEPGDAPEWHTE